MVISIELLEESKGPQSVYLMKFAVECVLDGEGEFALASALIKARAAADLTQGPQTKCLGCCARGSA